MVITIKKGMSPKQAQMILSEAQQEIWEQKKLKKIQSLKKLGGLLSRLKMEPMAIHKEMRDGWL